HRLLLVHRSAFELQPYTTSASKFIQRGSGAQPALPSEPPSCGLGAEDSDLSRLGSCSTFAINSSAPVLPSIYVSRFASSPRACSSLFNASTFFATAAGEKSSMLSK